MWQQGRLDERRVAAICDATHYLSVNKARAVQRRVLDRAPEQTVGQLKEALKRAVIHVDPEGAAERHKAARRDRRVALGEEHDGMASLWMLLTAADAHSCYQWLTRLARGCGKDDSRSMDARRADLAAALLSGRLTWAAPDTDQDGNDSEADTDSGADTEADTEADDRTDPETESATGGDDGTGSADGTGADGDHDAGSQAGTNTGIRADTGAGADTDAAAETDTDDTIPEATDTEAGTDAGTTAETDTDDTTGTAPETTDTDSSDPNDRARHRRGRRRCRPERRQRCGRQRYNRQRGQPVRCAGIGGSAPPDDRGGGGGSPPRPVNPGKPLVQVLMPFSTLIGKDDQPCELVGYGATAPRGALLYPLLSREGFGGRSLGLMAYLDPKGEGDKSMPGNRRSCLGVGGASGDPRDMAKAGLPEP